MNRWLMLLAGWAMATSAWAQLWTLTPASFQRHDGIMQRISPTGVELRNGPSVAWDDIVSLEQHAARPAASDAPSVLYTRDGQKLHGSPIDMDEQLIRWNSGVLGELAFALEDVRGWAVAGAELPAESAQEDRVILQNGDSVGGIVEGADEGVSLVRDNAATELKWEAIRAVSLARIGEVRQGSAALRLQITDGSTLLADSVTMEGDRLAITRGAARRVIPLGQVRSIQNEGGKVRFWTTLEPIEVRYTPYAQFSDAAPEPTVLLDEVNIGGASYHEAIQLRPRSTMRIDSPVDGKLHLEYAAGNAGRFTSMSLRISVGDHVVHEAQNITGDAGIKTVEAPVRRGQGVRVELDYGANLDVQDFLWMLNAAFVAQ